MRDRLQTSWLAAEFFTHSHRISGRLDVRQHKLADQLNSQSTQFLQIEDAYISSVEQPTDIVGDHASAFLWKDKILAVLVSNFEDALASQRSYGSSLGSFAWKVFITLPAFEVQGYLQLSSKLDLRVVFTTGTDRFMLVTNGQMQLAARPDIAFNGAAILINKQQIEAFWAEEERTSHG